MLLKRRGSLSSYLYKLYIKTQEPQSCQIKLEKISLRKCILFIADPQN